MTDPDYRALYSKPADEAQQRKEKWRGILLVAAVVLIGGLAAVLFLLFCIYIGPGV